MQAEAPFDLEAAVARWRARLVQRRAFRPEELEELESHLWDVVDARTAAGEPAREAFEAAQWQVGHDQLLASTFRRAHAAERDETRPPWHPSPWYPAMLKSSLKIALRNLRRHRGYAFINIGGLAVGLACALLIFLYVRDELRYDRFHEKADRLYRVVSDVKGPGDPDFSHSSQNGWPVGRLLREQYPEVEALTYLRQYPNFSVKHEGRYEYEKILYAEPAFFDLFSFPLLDGDPETALAAPWSLVLTERMAEKYFAGERAVGQVLTLNDTLAFTVTGVVRVPEHSHIQFDLLLSFETVCRTGYSDCEADYAGGWYNMNVLHYVLLKPGVSAPAFERKIADLVTRTAGTPMGYQTSLRLQPMTDVYLRSDRGNGLGPVSDIAYVYLLSAIAFFILVIACINFMNLATARSMERAKEVGVRKVVGSARGTLVRQFLSESVLTAALALVLALALAALALPYFNDLAGKAFARTDLFAGPAALVLVALVLVVGVLAGLYPAFVLSSHRPIEVLKGRYASSRRGVRLRQGLVVFQFAVSCFLIVGTLVVLSQLRYMQRQDVGFAREQLVVMDARRTPYDARSAYETIKEALARHTAVRAVSAAYAVPGRNGWRGQFSVPEGKGNDEGFALEYIPVDHDFVRTVGLELVAGRDFSKAFATDVEQAVLINETAVRVAGWRSAREAIGKRFASGGSGKPDGVVVGVVKDYHHHGLQEEILPIMYGINPGTLGLFALRVDPQRAADVVAHMERVWQQFFPANAFSYFFVDEDFDLQYQAEQRLTKIFVTFATLAILIACLGLFGLATFTAARRTKEIGVRKVMGASAPGIVVLLAKDFVGLVLAAFVVAAPAAYLAMDRWLEGFAYRVDLSWWLFAVAGGAALLVALLTVGYQALRAALADPVRSLRYE